MSITNTIQFVDFQEKTLSTEKLAEGIHNMIRQKRLAEANRILQESASDLEKNDKEIIRKLLSDLLDQAKNIFHEADTLETERKLEQALETYKKVEDIAIDYPQLPEALKRLDEAITLVQALEHRAQRRTGRQDNQSALLATPSQSGRSGGWFPLLVCCSLLLIMIGAGLFFANNVNHTLTEKDIVSLPLNKKIEQPEQQREEQKILITSEPDKQPENQKQDEQIAASEIINVLPPAPEKQIVKSVPPKIEEDIQQELSGHNTQSTLLDKTVSSMGLQLERKKSLSSQPVSSLQMKKKSVDTSGVEGEFTFRLEGQPTADPAWNFVQTMVETETPQLQGHIADYVSVADSEQLRQSRAVNKPPVESVVEISFSREESIEPVYTVQPGDMLGLISLKVYGASSYWPVIANANKDQLAENPDGLQVGMPLIIPTLPETGNDLLPAGSSISQPVVNEDGTYTVQPGDSLGIIAQKVFGNAWKWKKIYELNDDVLTAPHILKVGQVLRVKSSDPVTEMIESSEPEVEEAHPAVVTLGTGPS